MSVGLIRPLLLQPTKTKKIWLNFIQEDSNSDRSFLKSFNLYNTADYIYGLKLDELSDSR